LFNGGFIPGFNVFWFFIKKALLISALIVNRGDFQTETISMSVHSQLEKEPVGFIIKRLMKRCGLKEAELARMVNLPQTTINRLLTGTTYDPRANTLRPIANFFKLTIGQLLGDEPIDDEALEGYAPMSRRTWSTLPIISWDNIRLWLFERAQLSSKIHTEWVSTEMGLGNSAYALKAMPFMESFFPKGSVIIVDPDKAYTDGSYVIVSLNESGPTLRRVIQEGTAVFLNPLQPGIPSNQLTDKDMILGTVVESRLRL
tara:strand:- start:16889 stop:17662 length:774 start_codon:yes stop_codon:yes gene_type:complete